VAAHSSRPKAAIQLRVWLRRLAWAGALGLVRLTAVAQASQGPGARVAEAPVFVFAERMPAFRTGGGEGDWQQYLQRHIHLPAGGQENPKRFVATFVVTETGEIHQARITRSSGIGALDAEVIRAIRALPPFRPGQQNGVNVSVQLSFSMIICLQRAP